jgi:hypothetical protein
MLMTDPLMSTPGALSEGRADQGQDDEKRAARGLFL